MLTPEEEKAKREWEKTQLSEEDRLLRRAKRKKYAKERAQLIRERKIINDWDK